MIRSDVIQEMFQGYPLSYSRLTFRDQTRNPPILDCSRITRKANLGTFELYGFCTWLLTSLKDIWLVSRAVRALQSHLSNGVHRWHIPWILVFDTPCPLSIQGLFFLSCHLCNTSHQWTGCQLWKLDVSWPIDVATTACKWPLQCFEKSYRFFGSEWEPGGLDWNHSY